MLNIYFLILAQLHAFHLSRIEINHDLASHSIQITANIFIDDFEKALEEKEVFKKYIGTDNETEDADKYIESYLQEKFSVTADGHPLMWSYLGKEVSDDLAAIWVYLEIVEVQSFQKVKVTNSILTEVFDDQRNVVSIKVNQKQKAIEIFDDKTEEGEFDL